MPDQTLEYLIKTKAELAGANAALAALEKQIGAAKALGKDTTALSAQYARGKEAVEQYEKAHNGLADKLHETQHAHELLGVKGKELHKVMHELAEVSPEAGLALRAFFSPIGAAATTATAAFIKVKEVIDEINKALDEMGERASHADLLDKILARKGAILEAASEARKFAFEMSHLTSEESAYAQALDASLQILGAKADALHRVQDAQTAADEAQLKLKVARGQLTPEQAIVAEAKIHRDAADRAAKADQDKSDQDLTAREKAYQAAIARSGEADKKAEEARAKAAPLKSDQEADMAELGKKNAERPALKTAADAASAKAEAAQAAAKESAQAASVLPRLAPIAAYYAFQAIGPSLAAATAKKEYEDNISRAGQLETATKNRAAAVDKAVSEAAEAEKNARENRAFLNKEAQELPTLREKQRIETEARAQETRARGQAAGSEELGKFTAAGGAIGDIATDVAAAVAANQRLESGKGTVSDQNSIAQFVQQLTGRTVTLKQAEQYLDKLKDNDAGQAALVEKILSFAEKQVNQNQSAIGRLEEFERRLNDLASRLNATRPSSP